MELAKVSMCEPGGQVLPGISPYSETYYKSLLGKYKKLRAKLKKNETMKQKKKIKLYTKVILLGEELIKIAE